MDLEIKRKRKWKKRTLNDLPRIKWGGLTRPKALDMGRS